MSTPAPAASSGETARQTPGHGQVQPSPPPPHTEDLELIAALAADLADAGFTNHGVAELLGTEAVAALDREQVVPGQLRVLETLNAADQHQQRRGCAVLTALWLVSLEVTVGQVDDALPRTGTTGLQQLRLVEVRPDSSGGPEVVLPRADLRPYQMESAAAQRNLWVTSDLSAHQVSGALPHDHVLGVGQASLTLAAVTHRREAAAALDIGTGCGIQLIHLLEHCEHVTGTDLSARALEFARFNLLLNAQALSLNPNRLSDRVELLQGSLLEPLAGRRFDLVVSNPPFVITPRSGQETETDRYTYRDGGREGDALMAELITGLPEILNPGATVQMLGNWEVRPGSSSSSDRSVAFTGVGGLPEHHESSTDLEQPLDWTTRPRQWVQYSGLHAWFIQRDAQSPAEYAETWLRDASEERSIADFRRRYAHYLADFEARGVERIGFGLIWLQRPHEQTADTDLRRRFEQITGEVQQPLGPVLGETANRAAEADHAVLDRHMVVPDSVTEERYQRFGAEHPEVIIARQGAGLRRARPISSAAAGFLAAADGDFTAAQLITAVCSLTDTEETALSQEVLDLYTDGFLDS